jgi:hypothetical protein
VRRAHCRSRLFGGVRDPPETCQLTDRSTMSDREVLGETRAEPIWTAVERGFPAVVAEHSGLICGGTLMPSEVASGRCMAGRRSAPGLWWVLPVNRFGRSGVSPQRPWRSCRWGRRTYDVCAAR